MGWFDEQLRARAKADDEAFSDALEAVAGVFSGKNSGVDDVSEALGEIGRFLGVDDEALRKQAEEGMPNDAGRLFASSGVMSRNVELSDGWYRDACGVYLGKTKEGRYAALLPDWMGYRYRDYASGRNVRINSRTQNNLEAEALCFYRPLPSGKLKVRDLMAYAVKCVSLYDVIYIAVITLLMTLISMSVPYLMRILYSEVIFTENYRNLNAVFAFIVLAGISGIIFAVSRELVISRIRIKADVSVKSAVMMRLINLPAIFFRRFSSGELSQRALCGGMLCMTVTDIVFSSGLTAIMSAVYFVQIFTFSPSLVRPAIWIVAVMSVSSIILSFSHSRIMNRAMKGRAEEYGLLYALITGIQKIRLSGAEKRAFAKWSSLYAHTAKLEYNPPLLIKLTPVIQPAIILAGTFTIYFTAYRNGVSPEDYMAFTAAFGLLSGAFMGLCSASLAAAAVSPMSEMLRPILEEVPEVSQGRAVKHLRGGIELNSVCFRYSPKTPFILDNFSLKIRPGEYVAIVGRSGCGKSTLMRLLLGFERPESGVIYYDGNDIKTLDMRSVRSGIGCVMQNSRLFPGSIYDNIAVSSPGLTEEEAWKAAEMAGVAGDIDKMPMKMNTIISEGAGTISGGQRQRIIIARAIAPRPKILLFDEATSALDNITQKIVANSLDGLKCTRIVIAHRLSTVRHCGRIIVIDGGKIAEEGDYDSLMAKKGLFSELSERQKAGEDM